MLMSSPGAEKLKRANARSRFEAPSGKTSQFYQVSVSDLICWSKISRSGRRKVNAGKELAIEGRRKATGIQTGPSTTSTTGVEACPRIDYPTPISTGTQTDQKGEIA